MFLLPKKHKTKEKHIYKQHILYAYSTAWLELDGTLMQPHTSGILLNQGYNKRLAPSLICEQIEMLNFRIVIYFVFTAIIDTII